MSTSWFEHIVAALFEHHPSHRVRLSNNEMMIQSITTVISNLFALPLVTLSYNSGQYFEAIIGLCTFITSLFYHTGETLNVKILGMNPGQWHRLDNIFMIMSVNVLFFYLFQAREGDLFKLKATGEKISQYAQAAQQHVRKMSKREEIVRWSSMCFALWCQERAPWNELYTVVPIVIPSLFTIGMFVFVDTVRPVYAWKWIASGLVLFICAVAAFIVGLDDDHDWCRIYHGLWHLFISLAFYCLFHSKMPQSGTAKEKE